MPRTHLRRPTFSLGVLILSMCLLASCEDERDEAEQPILAVRVTADGLEPETLTVRVPEQLTLNVENATDSACIFHLGPWIRLDVPPGSQASMSFLIATEIDGERTEMGCEDRGVTGQVDVTELTNPPLTR